VSVPVPVLRCSPYMTALIESLHALDLLHAQDQSTSVGGLLEIEEELGTSAVSGV